MPGSERPTADPLPKDLGPVIRELQRITETLDKAVLHEATQPVAFAKLIARMTVTRLVLMRGQADALKAEAAILYELGERILNPAYNIQEHRAWLNEQ